MGIANFSQRRKLGRVLDSGSCWLSWISGWNFACVYWFRVLCFLRFEDLHIIDWISGRWISGNSPRAYTRIIIFEGFYFYCVCYWEQKSFWLYGWACVMNCVSDDGHWLVLFVVDTLHYKLVGNISLFSPTLRREILR